MRCERYGHVGPDYCISGTPPFISPICLPVARPQTALTFVCAKRGPHVLTCQPERPPQSKAVACFAYQISQRLLARTSISQIAGNCLQLPPSDFSVLPCSKRAHLVPGRFQKDSFASTSVQ